MLPYFGPYSIPFLGADLLSEESVFMFMMFRAQGQWEGQGPPKAMILVWTHPQKRSLIWLKIRQQIRRRFGFFFVFYCIVCWGVWVSITPKWLLHDSGHIAKCVLHFWNFQNTYEKMALRPLIHCNNTSTNTINMKRFKKSHCVNSKI